MMDETTVSGGMNIYLVYRTGQLDYDQLHAAVVVCRSPVEARALLADGEVEHYGNEGPEQWLDPDKSKVDLVGTYVGLVGSPHLLLGDFKLG